MSVIIDTSIAHYNSRPKTRSTNSMASLGDDDELFEPPLSCGISLIEIYVKSQACPCGVVEVW